tara:strand:- start:6518 stop:7987 length:1470 start_codon:yes stop_codon:yes gene_type:complete
VNNIYSTQQVKDFEEKSFIQKDDDLHAMISAAEHSIEILVNAYPSSDFLILCGPGNNGGDGYFIGLGLEKLQKSVKLVDVFKDHKKSRLCDHAFEQAKYLQFISPDKIKNISKKTVVVDAIFGIGGRINFGEKLKNILFLCNKFESRVAVDLPTGVDGNTGEIAKACFNADITITFIGFKLGQKINKGKSYCGEIILKDLGLNMSKNVNATLKEFAYEDIKDKLPKRKEDSHKGNHGKLLVIAGDEGLGGAGILSSESGIKTGAGLVRLLTRKSNISSSLSRNPEVMVSGGDNAQDLDTYFAWPDIIVAGPGMFKNFWSEQMLYRLLESSKNNSIPILLDAGALRLLTHKSFTKIKLNKQTVLTPHPGEAAEMLKISTNEIQKNRIQSAKQIQKKYGCIVVLKGYGTIICDKKNTYLCSSGGPELGVAGSGDILAGFIGALIAQGLTPMDAAISGVAIHAEAGKAFSEKVGNIGLSSSELITYIRDLLN